MTSESQQPDVPNKPGLPVDLEIALQQQFHRSMAIDPRMRRFARALAELGLPVAADWAEWDGDDGVDFASISWKSFDRMVCLFEDLAAHRPITVIRGQSGPTLFDAGRAPAPLPAPTQSSVHIRVSA
jgi:hypothetical protein